MKFEVFCHHITLVFIFAGLALGNVDLYLPKVEVERLFGVNDMQLYYIRDGVLNHNAISFVPHVQDDQDFMYFTWKATYSDITVLYEIENRIVEGSEKYFTNYSLANEMKSLIHSPVIDIDSSGEVPYEGKKFKVSVECTGAKSGEVMVEVVLKLRIYIDVNPDDITEIKLKRLKRCMEKASYQSLDDSINNNNVGKPSQSVTENKNNNEIPPLKPYGDGYNNPTFRNEQYGNHDRSSSSGSFFISIAVVTCVIIVTLIIVFVVWKSRTGNKHQNFNSSASGNYMMGINGVTQQNQFLRPDLPNNAQVMSQAANWMQLTPIINDLGTDISEIRSKLMSISTPRDSVVLKEILQEGTFARIFKGILFTDTPILVKTVSDVASEEQVRLLLYESSLLRGMHHRNILPVKHVVIEGSEPPLIVFPYIKGGNLKRYLQDLKLTDPLSGNSMISEHQNKYEQASTQDLVEIGIQVACGMSYMIKRGIVHKDLATRNCVIDSDLKVKITDNSLSRDLFPDDYCCLGDNENRPVRWLALESLIHKVYSSSSDVWSFGVLLWELQSFAARPYEDIDDFEMSVYLKDGYRLSQPVNCPDHLYDIMAQCWHYSSDKRPKFNQILQMLTEFNAELGEYV